MENLPTTVLVAAAAIVDRKGRLLLQQRPAHKHHGGMWEFPGGKVESEENPRLALCREIAEELGVTLSAAALAPAGFAEEDAGGGARQLVMLLYTCPDWTGDPVALEGQEWGWFLPEEAESLPLAGMDRALLRGLPERAAG